MKNIFLIPTDKSSKLSINCQTGLLQLGLNNRMFHDDINIYITSDEEIKDVRPHKGKWHLEKENILNKFPDYITDLSECKLVIMTTDQDLIKDGVQEIDDEFLEWFVKNPSCEKVGIIDDKKLSSKSIYDAVEGDLVYSHHGYGGIINSLSKDVRVGIDNYIETAITSETGWETLDINNYKIYDKCYKIIIPKEEPKQETLEEAYNRIFDNKLDRVLKAGFIAGAKWKAEKMYSEEEVKEILFHRETHYIETGHHLHIEEWFEQFKKK